MTRSGSGEGEVSDEHLMYALKGDINGDEAYIQRQLHEPHKYIMHTPELASTARR